MRIRVLRRRLRASGVCERELWNLHRKLKGKPEHECKPGGKYEKEWVKAMNEVFIYE